MANILTQSSNLQKDSFVTRNMEYSNIKRDVVVEDFARRSEL